MTQAEVKAVAQRIAEDLFTSRTGARADRLVLWLDVDERSLGGWAQVAVARRVRTELEAALAAAKDGRR